MGLGVGIRAEDHDPYIPPPQPGGEVGVPKAEGVRIMQRTQDGVSRGE